ncbi:MAG: hypothetical protein WD231_04545 [Candidatus Woykebacteria bacterium]
MVISVGKKNRYGHPHKDLLNLLASIDTEIYRTDQDGTVEIVTDGQGCYTNKQND